MRAGPGRRFRWSRRQGLGLLLGRRGVTRGGRDVQGMGRGKRARDAYDGAKQPHACAQAPCSEGCRAGRVGGEDGMLLTGDPAAGHVAVHDVSRELSDRPAGRKRKHRGNKEGQTELSLIRERKGMKVTEGDKGNVALQRRCDVSQWGGKAAKYLVRISFPNL